MHRSGFTLVELLVSGLLSTIVIGAAVTIFASSHQAYQTSGRMSQAQQSVRAALDIIAGELQMAGLGGQNRSEVNGASNPELEMALGPNCLNNSGSPDVIQFRSGMGAVSVTTQELSVSNGATGLMVDVHEIPAILGDGQDYFQQGMAVDLLDINRTRVAQAIVGDLGSVLTPESQLMLNSFSNVTESTLWPGTMIVQQPVWITYQAIGTRLFRCVRDVPTDACDGSLENTIPSPANPETDFVVVEDVQDIQYSYIVNSAGAVFDPAYDPSSQANRQLVLGVKIELLVRSKYEDASIEAGDDVKLKFYLGGNVVDVTGSEKFHYTQMSTIVSLPNASLNNLVP